MSKLRGHLSPMIRDAQTTLINSRAFPRALRSRAFRVLGHDVHTSALINPNVFLGARTGLRIGAKTFVNYGCFFDLAAPTHIGDRCDIGYEVMFVTASHEVGPGERRAGKHNPQPIRVGDGVWIGARATILPGVTIGDGCVIAAGAVVTKDCAPHGLYGGVPAARLRPLPTEAASDTPPSLQHAR